MPLTPSEQLVYDLCTKSFLSLWSYANPKQPKGKELADVLAVFGPHVIVFSVKEIELQQLADSSVAAKRWVRRAIDASIDQLRGARRIVETMDHVIRSDGSLGVRLPVDADRVVHLIAVAAGGKREVPFGGGVSNGHYVHVIDEIALREILTELDTAPDFIGYLKAKEAYEGVIICEGEEDLFAYYLHGGRRLPQVDRLLVQGGLWRDLQTKPEFKARKEADRISYWWDQRIEALVADNSIPTEAPRDPNELEMVVRGMASENRLERRVLSSAFLNWLGKKQRGGRMLYSEGTQMGYAFATCPRDSDRQVRVAELVARCLVARSPGGPLARCGYDVRKVIGLATEVYDPSGWSMDAVYLDIPSWTEEDERRTQEGRALFGIHNQTIISRASVDEFPRKARPGVSGNSRVAARKRKARRKEARKGRKRNR